MRRSTAGWFLGIHGFLLSGLAVFNVVVPLSAPLPVETNAVVHIGAMVGQVQIRRGGAEVWEPVKPGDRFGDSDEIRTGVYSEAILYLRGASSIVVSPNSNFIIGKEVVDRSSFELGEGQITATLKPLDQREYEFSSRGGDAVASAQQGEFSFANDGKGTVVVDNHEGNVKVQSKGKEVVLGKGKRSVVTPERPPSDAMPIPASLALQVKWPAAKLDRVQTTISGKTAAGAMVLVNGVMVRADAEGNFSLELPLRQGSNRLVVNATDSVGNSITSESQEIQVDTKPPDLKVDAQGLWK
jgi:hypothetical protein